MDADTNADRLSLIEAARAEYLERVSSLSKLRGAEFDASASELESWVTGVNASLSDAAREILGDGLAVNAESLAMLRLERTETNT